MKKKIISASKKITMIIYISRNCLLLHCSQLVVLLYFFYFYYTLLTVCWVVQMSAHNSGICEVPVVGAANSPPCLVVAHFHPSFHHCFSSSKTYIPLNTTRTDYKCEEKLVYTLVWLLKINCPSNCLP